MHLYTLLFLLLTLPCTSSPTKIKNQVSLQWTICDTSPQTVLSKIGQDPGRRPAKNDPITYYDSYPPKYTPQGLMFRTKVRAGEKISVVKVHLPDEMDLPRVAKKLKCRWDSYDDQPELVCSQQSPVEGSKIWSDKQVRLADELTSVDWDDLVQFGPYWNPKWKWLDVEGYRAVLDDVEALSLHLMELEIKVPRAKGHDVYHEITRYLIQSGVGLCDRQESRTMRLFRAMGFHFNDTVLPVVLDELQHPL